MKYKSNLREVVEQNQQLLYGKRYEDLYNKVNPRDRNILTISIINCGINPVDRLMDEVPEAMYFMNKSITELILPDRITTIKALAFSGCSKLDHVVLPKSISMIDYRAFYNCNNLHHIIYEGTMEQWQSVSVNFNPNWKENSPIKDIRCSDGTIEIGR